MMLSTILEQRREEATGQEKVLSESVGQDLHVNSDSYMPIPNDGLGRVNWPLARRNAASGEMTAAECDWSRWARGETHKKRLCYQLLPTDKNQLLPIDNPS